MSNRIEVDKVKDLFEKILKKPLRKKWIEKDSCCLLTALCLEKGLLATVASHQPSLFKIFGFSPSYQLGLRHGWDGLAAIFPANRQYSLGYKDGNAAWEEVNKNPKDLS